jgi:hypothetical protein
MRPSRRSFALGFAMLAAATPATAAPGDAMNGFWQGQLTPVNGPAIDAPRYQLGPTRFFIQNDRVQVFVHNEDGDFFEVKPGAFQIRRLATNAVITAIDSSAAAAAGQGWVESWSFSLTVTSPNEIAVVFTRQVNNPQWDPADDETVFTIVASGTMQRVFPDHV